MREAPEEFCSIFFIFRYSIFLFVLWVRSLREGTTFLVRQTPSRGRSSLYLAAPSVMCDEISTTYQAFSLSRIQISCPCAQCLCVNSVEPVLCTGLLAGLHALFLLLHVHNKSFQNLFPCWVQEVYWKGEGQRSDHHHQNRSNSFLPATSFPQHFAYLYRMNSRPGGVFFCLFLFFFSINASSPWHIHSFRMLSGHFLSLFFYLECQELIFLKNNLQLLRNYANIACLLKRKIAEQCNKIFLL